MNPKLIVAGLILALAAGVARAQSPLDQLNPPLISPAFSQTPDAAAIDAARPAGLKRFDLSGYAVLRCSVDGAQGLTGCIVLRETPGNNGLGQAALGLSAAYRLDKPLGTSVIFPVLFAPSRRLVDQTASGDAGLVQSLADALSKPQRDQPNLTILACQAGDDGALGNCAIDYQQTIDPDLAAFHIRQAQGQSLTPAPAPTASLGRQTYYFAYADGAKRAQPQLVNAPTPDSFYPVAAKGAAGVVKLACTVTADGFAKDCAVVSETPKDQGFANAALEYAGRSTFLPRQIDGENQDSPYAFTVRLAPDDAASVDAPPPADDTGAPAASPAPADPIPQTSAP